MTFRENGSYHGKGPQNKGKVVYGVIGIDVHMRDSVPTFNTDHPIRMDKMHKED